jgi:hypothetical protein
MDIKELEESGVMSFILSDSGAENMVHNNDDYYATIGKLLDDAGLEVATKEEDELVVESFEMVELELASWGGRIKRWVNKGRRFIARLMRKLMGWFCESDIIKNLRSPDSTIRAKAVAAIYNAACTALPRFCRLFGRIFKKLIAYAIKGLTYGVLKVVCPGGNESMIVGYEAMI